MIPDFLRRTVVFQAIRTRRTLHALRSWSAHDQELLEFYSQFISPGALCFDVGANAGGRVKIFLRLEAEVVAIEPQARCVTLLRKAFGDHPRLDVVPAALGDAEGQTELMLCSTDQISSMSPEWIDAGRRSGRFPSSLRWETRTVVPMTTLDRLIERHGVPSFIKIDVEGAEYRVIRGLSRPVESLSLEFFPEYLEPIGQCIDHMRQLGHIRLNYSPYETMRLALERWVSPKEMMSILSGLPQDHHLYGDVYVRFVV